MTFGWHPREHRAALDGMLMLTLEERGAYNTVLDLIYDRAGPIPDDARWLAGWMGVSLKRWAIIRASLVLKAKIYAINVNGADCLMNDRAAKEIENQAKLQRNARENGAKGGRKRAENDTKVNENNASDQAPLKGSLKLKTETKTLTREEEEANASLSPGSDANGKYPDVFEACWKAYPHIKGRSSKTKAFGYWRRLPAETRTQLLVAIGRYAAKGREPNSDCGAPALERWLRDTRYLDWLTAEQASAAVAHTFPGPAEIRAAVVSAMGEDFAKAWLDRCEWDADANAVVSSNGFVVDRLRREVGSQLSARDVRIVRKAA